MKQLLKREAEAQKEEGEEAAQSASGAPWFANALLEEAGGALSAWASKNRGSFVVAALEGVPSASAGVREVLGKKAARARLVKEAKNGNSMGAKVCACKYGCFPCWHRPTAKTPVFRAPNKRRNFRIGTP